MHLRLFLPTAFVFLPLRSAPAALSLRSRRHCVSLRLPVPALPPRSRALLRALLPLLALLFPLHPLAALEIKSFDPLSGLEWTFETTQGFQNITNIVMSKESGTQSTSTEALMFAGILFHSDLQSYTRTRSFVKCAINLGFRNKPHFFWSDSAYEMEDEDFSAAVRSMEFDAQFLLPVAIVYWITLRPFVGYTYIDYTYEEQGLDNAKNRFNTFVVGAHYEAQPFRWLKTNAFVSYSPLLYANYENEFLRYLYYGGELISNTHPFAFTFFVAFRKAFKKNRYYFDVDKYNDNTAFDFTEIGMSCHMNL